ncbi:MAG: histidine kinase [Blastocatellia bacterium]|nr:histidine kinase [Blastocatellia bacterium]
MKSSGLKNRLSPFWVLQSLAWGAYGFMIYITLLPALPPEGSAWRLFFIKFVRTAIGFAMSLALHRIYKHAWSRSLSLRSIAALALFSSVAFGCAWLVVYKFFGWLMNPAGFHIGPLSAYPREAFDFSYVLFAWSASYFGIKYWQDSQAQKERTLTATAEAHRAQLEMLRYQLNPHFLFNALNSIRASIDEDRARAKEMVTEFSEFLRYSLLNSDSSPVPLREEIEAIRNYLAIEKIRFEERLEVEFDIEPMAEEYRLPGFLIHPLIENAIKHGMSADSAPLVIRLSARVDNGSLRVEVANTGRLKASGNDLRSNATGIGLQNISQRLERLFPGRSLFDIREEDGWVRAVIEIRKS